ncbi:MAG: hypothetical protein SF182_19110 [Deltaproteobacteria bacterium]|nr:hypothetical protein [Deltaproteobacteria bacterium]
MDGTAVRRFPWRGDRRPPRARQWWLLGWLLGGLALALILAVGTARRDDAPALQPPRPHGALGGLRPLGTPPQTAQVVTVGLLPTTVYDLNVEANTYYIDAYLWLRWRGDGEPMRSLEFVNAVEDWGAVADEEVRQGAHVLADGSHYEGVHIEGRFFQAFDLSDFPLDRHRLTVLIEDRLRTVDQIVYLPDLAESGIGDTVRIPGWDIVGWQAEPLVHVYDSNFGESDAATTAYASYRYELTIVRPLNYFVWKLLLPLLIVLGINWTTLCFDPRQVEVRSALPASALLAAVFLQQSYSNALPEVGYLVLLDKIYVLAYAALVVTLVRVIWVARHAAAHAADDYRRARQHDRLVLGAQVAAFALGCGALVLLR